MVISHKSFFDSIRPALIEHDVDPSALLNSSHRVCEYVPTYTTRRRRGMPATAFANNVVESRRDVVTSIFRDHDYTNLKKL